MSSERFSRLERFVAIIIVLFGLLAFAATIARSDERSASVLTSDYGTKPNFNADAAMTSQVARSANMGDEGVPTLENTLRIADEMYQNKRFNDAEKLYEQYVSGAEGQKKPQLMSVAYHRLGLIARKRQQYQKAQDYLILAMKTDSSQSQQITFDYAQILFDSGEFVRAANLFQYLMSKDPRNQQIKHFYGLSLLQQGAFRQAYSVLLETLGQEDACSLIAGEAKKRGDIELAAEMENIIDQIYAQRDQMFFMDGSAASPPPQVTTPPTPMFTAIAPNTPVLDGYAQEPIAQEPIARESVARESILNEIPTSVEAPVPIEAPAPVEAPTPFEAPTLVEAPTRVDVPVPVETPTLVEAPTRVDVPVPVEAPTLVEAPVPVEAPIPVEAPTLVEAPVPVDSYEPTVHSSFALGSATAELPIIPLPRAISVSDPIAPDDPNVGFALSADTLTYPHSGVAVVEPSPTESITIPSTSPTPNVSFREPIPSSIPSRDVLVAIAPLNGLNPAENRDNIGGGSSPATIAAVPAETIAPAVKPSSANDPAKQSLSNLFVPAFVDLLQLPQKSPLDLQRPSDDSVSEKPAVLPEAAAQIGTSHPGLKFEKDEPEAMASSRRYTEPASPREPDAESAETFLAARPVKSQQSSDANLAEAVAAGVEIDYLTPEQYDHELAKRAGAIVQSTRKETEKIRASRPFLERTKNKAK